LRRILIIGNSDAAAAVWTIGAVQTLAAWMR
jgi:hypothetical protein